MDLTLDNKVVLVTGAAGPMGISGGKKNDKPGMYGGDG